MLIVNFSHPLTDEQVRQIAEMTGHDVDGVIDVRCQVDLQQPLVPQVVEIVNSTGLSPQQWQTLPIIVNPPGLSHITAVLVAELHGRCGYFPAILRIRPVPDTVPPRYEVAEIISLQGVREEARKRR